MTRAIANPGMLADRRALAGQLAEWTRQVLRLVWTGLCVAARSVRVMAMVLHFGLVWGRFCVEVHIARWETKRQHTRVSLRELKQGLAGSPEQRRKGVPGIRGWTVGTHGATVKIRSRIGQDLDTYRDHMSALASTLMIQHARVRPVGGKPGRYLIDLLWRDPLGWVELTPHVDGKRVIIARNEHGQPAGVDFGQNPHLLVPGATGSGKSSYVNALLYALAGSEDQVALIDLKFGLEAQTFGARASVVCEDPQQAKETVDLLIERAQARADILKHYQVRDIGELEAKHGIRLQRVFVFVDEVAELSLAELPDEEAKEAKDRIEQTMGQVLRLVQLVRAMGMHVILAGQRFGSDIGPKVTSIRAQIGGRAVGKCNDNETVDMALPGIDKDVRAQVMNFDRPGLMGYRTGSSIEVQRPPYYDTDALLARSRATAEAAMPLTALAIEDEQRAYGTPVVEGMSQP